MAMRSLGLLIPLLLLTSLGTGCTRSALRDAVPEIAHSDIPRELEKMSHPAYRVEPPDILLIEAVSNIRPPNDPLRAGDELVIRVSNTLPTDPMGDPVANDFKIINNIFRVQSNGSVDLGPEYGSVVIAGQALDGARVEIERHLRNAIGLKNPQVAVSLPNVNGKQPITGDHIVRPDGTVSLGVYGAVYVAGMTLAEVKQAVEEHLGAHIHAPEVQVDVLSYNSKVFYVITDGGGIGEQVIRLPCTGNETVLDAIAAIQGLSAVSSKRMWVARPAPAGIECAQVMEVDWRAITQDGVTATNYQLYPGDRIYIKADGMIAFDNFVAKVVSPFERIFGFILLGNGTVRSLQQGSGGFGGGVGVF